MVGRELQLLLSMALLVYYLCESLSMAFLFILMNAAALAMQGAISPIAPTQQPGLCIIPHF